MSSVWVIEEQSRPRRRWTVTGRVPAYRSREVAERTVEQLTRAIPPRRFRAVEYTRRAA